MKHPILVIAVSLALLSFEVDCVDTISDKKKNEGEAEDYFSAKVKERRLNSDSNPKLVIAGLGDVGVGHGHGHNHHANKSIDWDSVQWDKLTPEEKWRLEHMKMHEKHKGHESMHAEMILILFATLIISQIALVKWRQTYPNSYHLCTLIGMWVIPFFLSAKNAWIRFIVIWSLFTLITAIVMRKALEKPIGGSTPRHVYKWFLLLYKVSYVIGILGYIIMMATFMGFYLFFGVKPHVWMDIGLLMMFYALYYGVMARDVAEICTEKMVSGIGYYKPGGMPARRLDADVCALCGNQFLVKVGQEGVVENTYRLTCSHEYHEFCIRGWCLIGKKQTCPYCHEKVDLKKMFPTPWQQIDIYYGELLEWVRWLVCWQPIVLTLVQGLNYLIGLQ